MIHFLQSLTFVDLNARTLDGRLAEEMCEDKSITKLVHRARTLEPKRCVKSLKNNLRVVGSCRILSMFACLCSQVAFLTAHVHHDVTVRIDLLRKRAQHTGLGWSRTGLCGSKKQHEFVPILPRTQLHHVLLLTYIRTNQSSTFSLCSQTPVHVRVSWRYLLILARWSCNFKCLFL